MVEAIDDDFDGYASLLGTVDLGEVEAPKKYAETELPAHTDLFKQDETVKVLLKMMEKAQGFEGMSGAEKKEWVMTAFKYAVNHQHVSAEKKTMLMRAAPGLIDTLKAAFKHNTEELAIPHTVTNVPGISLQDAKEKLILDQMHMLYVSFKDGLQMHNIAPAVVTTFHMVEEFLELNSQERQELQVDLLTELLRRVFPDYANPESTDHLIYSVLLPLAESAITIFRLAFGGIPSLHQLAGNSFFSCFKDC